MRKVHSQFVLVLTLAAVLVMPVWAQESGPDKKGKTEVQEEKGRKDGDVPLLSSIPMLKSLFRHKDERNRQNGLNRHDSGSVDFPRVELKPSFLHRVQVETLLNKIPGLSGAELVTNSRYSFGPKSAEAIQDSKLIFSGTKLAQSQAQTMLSQWQKQDSRAVTVAYFFVARRPILSRRGLASDGIQQFPSGVEKQGPHVEVMTDAAFEEIMTSARGAKGTVVIVAPSLTILQGKTGRLAMVNQVSYIKDFAIEMAGNSIVADPVVGVIDEGIRVQVTPVVSLDGSGVVLTCRAEATSLRQPMQDVELQLARNLKMKGTIQIPHKYKSEVVAERVRIQGDKRVFRLRGLKRLKHDDQDEFEFVELFAKVIVAKK